MLKSVPGITWAIPLIMAGAFSIGVASADTIAGPTLTEKDLGYDYSGIGFTANVNATLTGFTLQNQGAADNVILVDPLGNILDSVPTPAGTPSDTVSGLSWALTVGHQYYLLQSTDSNSLFASWGSPGPSDTQITLTDTGDFSLTSPASADFTYGGGGSSSGTAYWAAFNNIVTTSGVSSVPEPGYLALILPTALAIVWRAKCK